MKTEVKDTIQVLAANGVPVGFSLTQCNEILLFISTTLAILFTLYKWFKISKDK
tara:strand:- start:23 stop:184 length:162 start_codon:yes stop_codon:yes gene_type:complete